MHILRNALRHGLAVLLAIGLFGGLALPAKAKILRYAGSIEFASMEPYHVTFSEFNGFMQNIYEPLVAFDNKGEVVPRLATEWQQVEPKRWRFKLRQGVKFQEGESFTADDVLFSAQRARSNFSSGLQVAIGNVSQFIKVDDYTVDMVTDVVDVVLPRRLTSLDIVSKSWAEKNNALEPADRSTSVESYATRHANGTGAFQLVEFNQGISVEVKVNPNWWGPKRTDQLTGAKYFIIKNPATMTAGLLSGEIDLIVGLTPALLDRINAVPGIRVESGRAAVTLNLGFDISRPELLASSVKGKNPFSDRRVREAVNLAVDADAIVQKIYRGYGYPADLLIGPDFSGYVDELNKRPPVDIAKAKQLMADAGYPDGFQVAFDCPSGTYLNDEVLCTAISIMVAAIGIKADPQIESGAKFSQRVGNFPPGNPALASFRLNGSLNSSYDSTVVATNLLHTFIPGKPIGLGNQTGWSNAEFDGLLDQAMDEQDPAKRFALAKQYWAVVKRERPMLALLQPPIIWAMRDNVTATPNSGNRVMLFDVTLK